MTGIGKSTPVTCCTSRTMLARSPAVSHYPCRRFELGVDSWAFALTLWPEIAFIPMYQSLFSNNFNAILSICFSGFLEWALGGIGPIGSVESPKELCHRRLKCGGPVKTGSSEMKRSQLSRVFEHVYDVNRQYVEMYLIDWCDMYLHIDICIDICILYIYGMCMVYMSCWCFFSFG